MKKIILFILLILFVLLYYLVNSSIYDYKKNNLSFIKDIIPINIKQSIKYYFLHMFLISNPFHMTDHEYELLVMLLCFL